MRGEHPVIARQMHPRWRHQRRQPGHEIHRLQHDVRRAVAIRGLQTITDLPLRREREPLDRHRRPADVTGQPFELPTLLGFDAAARVQREPRVLGLRGGGANGARIPLDLKSNVE